MTRLKIPVMTFRRRRSMARSPILAARFELMVMALKSLPPRCPETSWNSVAVEPGQTQVTLTGVPLSSAASDSLKWRNGSGSRWPRYDPGPCSTMR